MGRGYSHLQLDIVSFKWWGSGKMNLCSDLSMISTWTEPLFCPGNWKRPRIREIWQPPSSKNVDLLAKKLSELWKAIEIPWSYYQSQTHTGVLKPCRGVLQSCRGSYVHAEGSCGCAGGPAAIKGGPVAMQNMNHKQLWKRLFWEHILSDSFEGKENPQNLVNSLQPCSFHNTSTVGITLISLYSV